MSECTSSLLPNAGDWILCCLALGTQLHETSDDKRFYSTLHSSLSRIPVLNLLIVTLQEMRVIVTNYGSYIKALQSAFPEVKFQEAEFSSMPSMYSLLPFPTTNCLLSDNFWTDIQNRYKFLSKLARRNGFDPLVPEGWYSIPPDIIMHDKVTSKYIPNPATA